MVILALNGRTASRVELEPDTEEDKEKLKEDWDKLQQKVPVRLEVLYNGKPVQLIPADGAFAKPRDGSAYLAILAPGKTAGVTVAVTGLKIHRLTEEPMAPAQ